MVDPPTRRGGAQHSRWRYVPPGPPPGTQQPPGSGHPPPQGHPPVGVWPAPAAGQRPLPPPHPAPLDAASATPRPRRTRPAQVIVLVAAVIASLALASGARPQPGSPPGAAARLVAASGQRVRLVGDDADWTVETSRADGAGLFQDATAPMLQLFGAWGLDRLQRQHWVLETHVDAESQTPFLHTLGPEGLLTRAVGTGLDGMTMEPGLVEVPANPRVGATWDQRVTVTSVLGLGAVSLHRRGRVEASPLGPGCLEFQYEDASDDGVPTTSSTTRCPGRGIVALDESRATTTWPGTGKLDLTPRHARWAGLRHQPGGITAFDAPFTATMNRPPVALGHGLALPLQANGHLTLAAPRGDDATNLELGWRRRPGLAITGLLEAGEVAIAATTDRQLVAYDQAGIVRWSTTLTDITSTSPLRLDERTIAVLTLDGYLSAHDIRTGARLWRTAAPAGDAVHPVVTRHEGRPVVAVANGREVVLLDEFGPRARVPLLEAASAMTPLPDGGVVVADEGRQVLAIGGDGAVLWHRWARRSCRAMLTLAEAVLCDSGDAIEAISPRRGSSLWIQQHADIEHVLASDDGQLAAVVTRQQMLLVDARGGVVGQWALPALKGSDLWLVPTRRALAVVSSVGEYWALGPG